MKHLKVLRAMVPLALALALIFSGPGTGRADYLGTQGSGTSFGSQDVASVKYTKFVICDFTAPATQCAGVNSSGFLLIAPGSAAAWGLGATGSAVPANAQYHGISVAGNLRGATGLAVGSTFSQTVAVVDASGNQITSFGGSGGTASNFGSAFPSTGTAIGVSDGTNMIALRAGTAGTAASTVLSIQGIASMTKLLVTPDSVALPSNQSVNVSQINGVAPLMGNGVTGTGSPRVTIASDNTTIPVADAALLAAAQAGTGLTGATAPASAILNGGRAASTAPTAVTDGQLVAALYGLEGKAITLPYAIKELQVRGSTTSTDTSAHTIIASAGGSLKNYITDWECSNSSATSTLVTFNDSAATVVILPAGGGNNKTLNIPLATAAATAFQFTSGTGVSTVYCSAQGYTGL